MATKFNVNEVCWDKVNNEYVRISNVHDDVNMECVALRVVGMKGGRAITGWTYKRCEAKNLIKTTDLTSDQFTEMVTGGRNRRTPYNVGRV